MRKFILFTLLVICTGALFAQNSSANAGKAVKWSFASKKTGDKVYEIHLTATVNDPWHIYSQTTPDGGPMPTKISFNKNPLITLEGKLKESGKVVKKYEEVFDMEVKYFDGNVVFTQKLKLKSSIKTTIGGIIEFMACNDEQCLPPAEVPFTIILN